MANLLYANNAVGTLAASITSASTSLVLGAGQAVAFPAPTAGQSFYVTLTDAATQTLKEIVQVTAVAGDVFSIIRAQDGTTALSWNTNDIVQQCVIAQELRGFENAAEGIFLGDISVGGTTAITGNLNVTGNANLFSNLNVTGNANLFSNANLTGHLDVTGTVQINANTVINSTLITGSGIVDYGNLTMGSSSIIPNTTLGIVGTTLGDNASAGRVGEYLFFSPVSPIATYSGVVTNLGSITLSAGDWMIYAMARTRRDLVSPLTEYAFMVGGSTAPTTFEFGHYGAMNGIRNATFLSDFPGVALAAPKFRVSITSDTVYYLNASVIFSSSGINYLDGTISARRMR
jgi:hypothetical protein